MKFNYEDIKLGDLDIEFNYINFGIICDGDKKQIICEDIEKKVKDDNN